MRMLRLPSLSFSGLPSLYASGLRSLPGPHEGEG